MLERIVAYAVALILASTLDKDKYYVTLNTIVQINYSLNDKDIYIYMYIFIYAMAMRSTATTGLRSADETACKATLSFKERSFSSESDYHILIMVIKG